MQPPVFLKRVVLRNYKSIASCDVRLAPLTYLVGPNGSGKSNFLDALHLVKDALSTSLDNAVIAHGGMENARHRSMGHPLHFGVRLEFTLPGGEECRYAFTVGGLASGGFEVFKEECRIAGKNGDAHFLLERGRVLASSEPAFPSVTADRLALGSASGLAAFNPAYVALTAMGFYDLDHKVIRELQKPQDGRLLKPAGENVASVLGYIEKTSPDAFQLIQEYLRAVVPSIRHVERKVIGPAEVLSFTQEAANGKSWSFLADSMSDGTLRTVAILTALFQGNGEHRASLIGIEEPEIALHPGASAALREALVRATERTQVIVTSHSPDLLDDMSITPDSLLVFAWEEGVTRIVPLGEGSRTAMRQHLCSAGELLRLNQLNPDPILPGAAAPGQAELFGE